MSCWRVSKSQDAAALLASGTLRSSLRPWKGFTATFDIPYKREDVFTELLKKHDPLGLTAPNVKLTVLTQDSLSSKVVRSPVALQIERHINAGSAGQVSVGCVRKAEFSKPFEGFTVSRLVDVQPLQSVRWEQLQTRTLFNLVGEEIEGERVAPAATVHIETIATGARIYLIYDFHHVQTRSSFCCFLAPLIPRFLRWYLERNAANTWSAEMERRGYTSVTLLESGTDAKALRSAEQKRRDQQEEARIKGKALAAKKVVHATAVY
mmetsp:Transcript_59411/g.98479  ORF Transcript_59411/g.98479 Transcript_59411/m.98479 type:complete len:265 (-) Transcript_59411:118-912(-)|eukprot:CAMPEP_0119343762 /NCGR_PEP_ID=MMETSP1333-20130426/106621_1 /TAXON_ID=418940 /ORGANISM="Scyphosphaera apsteinii, Strain RCC1455" /LENGTH=264 /DNA_ID=CAMNT_0007356175 /DNA_START=910 /DNA_END=1704 /DNA_ORIENTATION=-